MNWKQAFALGLCSVGAYVKQDGEWEVLYDETFITKEVSYLWFNEGYNTSGTVGYILKTGDNIRLTVNGESHNLTVWSIASSSGTEPKYIGNPYILSRSGTDLETGEHYDIVYGEDNGYDFCLALGSSYLYSRYPGTYTVKIERTVAEKYKCNYNGVVLPKLPEWDKETYPYAVIYKSTINTDDNEYTLSCTKDPFWYRHYSVYDGIGQKDDADGSISAALWFEADVGGTDVWRSDRSVRGWGKNYYIKLDTFLWANHDILYEDDNTVYRATSDPIPVYS